MTSTSASTLPSGSARSSRSALSSDTAGGARPKVLIAEDDPEISQALERILTYEGYETRCVRDGAAALEEVHDHPPDLVVLDVMMPFVDGLSACRQLRRRGDRTPVLMLTAKAEPSAKVEGLDAGADDYVCKPFVLDELLARLRALLRRNEAQPEDGVIAVGPLRLDSGSRQAWVNGVEVELTRTEFAVLELLMRNAGIVLERGVIYDRVWGYDFGDSSRSLDVHVGYLRRKLEADGTPRVIQTVRGVGFVLREDAPGHVSVGEG
ncbi:MAG: response regulator transcription factor [Microthrixaceae bacterium]|nr:response regulator transcription factor [Microthrixaceae bacterium]